MSSKSLSSASKAASKALSSASSAASKSSSSASKAASSALTSGTSQAVNAASTASASLASGSAKASAYAGKVANELPKKSTGIVSTSTLFLTVLAIALGAAYYNGYLDSLIAYIQQLLNQTQDQKEKIMKDNTGTTSVRTAAKDKLDQGTVRTQEKVDELHAKAQQQETGRVQPSTRSGDSVPMLSSQTH